MSSSDASAERPEATHDATIVVDKVTLTLGSDSLLIVGKGLRCIHTRPALANWSCR